ncbi:hypothetical protein NKG05_10345 [Oerskovia sp. M15]
MQGLPGSCSRPRSLRPSSTRSAGSPRATGSSPRGHTPPARGVRQSPRPDGAAHLPGESRRRARDGWATRGSST